MAIEIKVPPLGESLVDAVVGQWLKSEGEEVSRGETILELETDKVNLEVTAEDDGVLGAIQRQEGDTVTVGEVLGTLEAGAGGGGTAPAAPADEATPLANNPEAAPDPATGGPTETATTAAPGRPPPRRRLLPRRLPRQPRQPAMARMRVGALPRL
jgi:2-oxoglutarate dehydrogenase E2 component (dihydrolipoamide succinyltransferase)